MIKCKVCGTANSPDSSVCIKCGAALMASQRESGIENDKDIFSSTGGRHVSRPEEQRIDLFSSGEKYEKVRKGAVLEKIYKQEQAMGEVSSIPQPSKPETVKPKVINRESSSDIIRRSNRQESNYKIPQRIIEPTDSQLLGHKIKPKLTDNRTEDSDEKVELTAGDDVIKELKHRRKPSGGGQRKIKSKPDFDKSKTKQFDRVAGHVSRKSTEVTTTQPPKKRKPAESVKTAEATTAQPPKKRKPAESVKTVEATTAQPPKKRKSAESVKTAEATTAQPTKKRKPAESVKTAEATTAQPTKKRKPAEGVKPAEATTAQPPKKRKPAESVKTAEATTAQPPKKRKPAEQVKQTPTNEKKSENRRKRLKKSDSDSKPYTPSVIGEYDFTESDINSHKYIAALAYIGVLFIFPLLKSGKSNFCKAHAKQGIAVFVYSLIVSIISLSVAIGLQALLVWQLGLDFIIYRGALALVVLIMLALILIPVFTGAVTAFSGAYNRVPIVGKFVKKK